MGPCRCTRIKEENEFSSVEEFQDIEKEILRLGLFEIPVTLPEPIDCGEKWYQCSNCPRIWSLVPPNPLSPGTWIKIRLSEAKVTCPCVWLYEDDYFPTPSTFWDLRKTISSSSLFEVPVTGPSATYFEEKWYRCKKCGNLWSLIGPDYPAMGSWKKIPGEST